MQETETMTMQQVKDVMPASHYPIEAMPKRVFSAVSGRGQRRKWVVPKMRVLLADGDPKLGEAIRKRLVRAGHAVDLFTQLEDARLAMETVVYDFVLLELFLPDSNGTSLLRQVRSRGDAVPIMILSYADQVDDRLQSLDDGADDCIIKPFDLRELEARINAVARRSFGLVTSDIAVGNVRIDSSSRSVSIDGRPVNLTAREWIVLELMIARGGTTVTKDELETRMYDFGAQVGSNTVEVFISRIRKKLGRDLIKTERGLGYRLNLRL